MQKNNTSARRHSYQPTSSSSSILTINTTTNKLTNKQTNKQKQSAGAGLIELRRIEAARDVADTMARSGNVVYLPGGGNVLLGVNPR
jgi:hypothetical protein